MSACTTPVKKVDYKRALSMPEDAHPTPIKFSGIELLLPPGTDIGYELMGKTALFGRSFCMMPRIPVNRSVLRRAIDSKFLKQSFHDAMEANGYDVVGSLDISFGLDDEERRSEYSIKGKVKDAHLDMCNNGGGGDWFSFYNRPGQRGEMYLAIDWSIYDSLRRYVVYKTRTEGYTKRRYPNQEGLTLMFHDAFEMAVHNLAADPDFYNLIVKGEKPPKTKKQSQKEKRFQDRPRLFDPQEKLTLPAKTLSTQPLGKHIERSRKVAVMIQKIGHGSGFFISEQGHILTNAHVVGDAMRMRVVTADKENKLIAEVLRVDKARDVALLKLEKIPVDMEIVTLPLRTTWPGVSEDVYALGAPQSHRIFQDTVTKGIVSAHRRGFKIAGVRENYIQADVDVHGGNSGGALLDEYGNIVGMSVMGYSVRGDEGSGIGLNLFVPIDEALARLDIQIQE